MTKPSWLQAIHWTPEVEMRYHYQHKEMERSTKGMRNTIRKISKPPNLITQQLQELAHNSGGLDTPSSDQDEELMVRHFNTQLTLSVPWSPYGVRL